MVFQKIYSETQHSLNLNITEVLVKFSWSTAESGSEATKLFYFSFQFPDELCLQEASAINWPQTHYIMLVCPQIGETQGSGGWVGMCVIPCHVGKKKENKLHTKKIT